MTPCRAQALWFVGLPGSGKSSVARLTLQLLLALGAPALHLEMDARRKVYFPEPNYSPEEREQAYRLFIAEAAELVASGACVLMDGTANRLALRREARALIPRFTEVHVVCSLETAMRREAERPEGRVRAGLYAQARERKRTGVPVPGLGEVVGVDVPFEVDPQAELVLDSEVLSPEDCAVAVVDHLLREVAASGAP